MITCKEVARRISSGEIADAPLLQRFGMRIHLLMCRYCRRYSRQMQTIGAFSRKAWSLADEDQERLDRLKKTILQNSPKRAPKGKV